MTTATASAPGRLDVLGGVGDYSGSWVLELPIAARTSVTVTVAGADWRARSDSQPTAARIESAAVERVMAAADPAAAAATELSRAEVPTWSRYVLGSALLAASEVGWMPPGLELDVRSDVPEAMSVSSSAAIEVATMRAISAAAGRAIDPLRLAHLAQRAENLIVGAPCGLMDQLSSSCGRPGAFLPILCRPDLVGEPIAIPDELLVVGWPSGHRHTVSGSPYRTARTAAFLARAILRARRPLATGESPYLTDADAASVGDLPVSLAASEVDCDPGDPLSAVVPGESYPVRAAAEFAIGEHRRAQRAIDLLTARWSAESGVELGRLLRASHDGYSSIGLGAPITDRMVTALDGIGPGHGIYGGRVSGGGSGGTVVVVAHADALPTIERLAADHGTALIHAR